ncbi:hypothetical protein ABH37_10095 [Mycobacterium haemophilum]|uniref:Uncharacterized protein n=1 Tax=Mycobacterium haemophilum TaxID=29311 RepID=A0A0I9U3E4_9MYCO|nr:hypothetical protein ABH39_07555 [Mycobacterium haemophilum]KLO36591.1 hypothetical protein ABH38_11470 [Mycobacterium haemophilum]KLO42517.1 hypothetical protein ABH37_10095 [Mycobacterium haemophilum]KLO55394.1 hypothetical protein ABH36_07075 [Mycobacterium haemophilum]
MALAALDEIADSGVFDPRRDQRHWRRVQQQGRTNYRVKRRCRIDTSTVVRDTFAVFCKDVGG